MSNWGQAPFAHFSFKTSNWGLTPIARLEIVLNFDAIVNQ